MEEFRVAEIKGRQFEVVACHGSTYRFDFPTRERSDVQVTIGDVFGAANPARRKQLFDRALKFATSYAVLTGWLDL